MFPGKKVFPPLKHVYLISCMLEARHMRIYGVAQNERIIPPSKRCGSLDTEAKG